MGYTKTSKKYNGTIKKVSLGTGEKAFEVGGRNAMPFYKFDGEVGEKAKVGIEIVDVSPSTWSEAFAELYKEAGDDTAAWAKLVEEKYSPDFICLRLEGADPDGVNKSVDECVEIAKKVEEAISVPLAVAGCKNNEKDAQVLTKVAEALEGKNVLLLSANEETYKTVGAQGALAYRQIIGAESSVDINLAKQLNILMGQLGVKEESIIMNVGCAAAGYGYEYVSSTMDRILLASLGQNDTTLQMPIVTPIAFDTWSVKESVASEADEPTWGDVTERGIQMEISTAISSLVSGSDMVIVRHPQSVTTVKSFIDALA